ncbi:16S rRNA processing protein rimM [Granulibacter bethesdensis]|uniref:ribosome maturation factor RimM n=1 Tax=Granulibacter bethesdensis TaxID=364410 RepID=UPI00090C987C|nr:ribosome maturation factor RimM [Granulibacter bethesdensis]APH57522.1 16S rRNA processing protein rimM [Granulibacter bethesdensis]
MSRDLILLGVIGRPHGVRGLVHVVSYTADPDDLTAYGSLRDEAGRQIMLDWRADGLASITIDGVPVQDRSAAERLTNTRLFITRDALPPVEDEDDFYLVDLIGLEARLVADETLLGQVAQVHDYGAGASLEITRSGGVSLLVPFTRAAVPMVDIAAGRVLIDPPQEENAPEFGQNEREQGCDDGGEAA